MRERQPEPFSLGRIFFGRFANLFRARWRSRRQFGHPARRRIRLEALEDRVLLSADLIGVPSLDTANELLRPGDAVEATVLVQNVGDASTRRSAQVDLYASLDGVLDPSDILLDSELTESRMGAGSSDSVDFRFSLPSTLKPDDYSLISVVDADFDISESNEANNVGVGEGFSVAWTFGNEALTVRDADGTLVSFSLSGPGSGAIEVVGGEWDVRLTGTDGTSLFSVFTFGGNHRVTLDDIHVAGALGGMHAPAVDVTGTLGVEGPLGTGLLIGSASGAAIVAPTIAGGEVFGFSVGGIAILGDVADSEIVIGADAGGRLGDLLVAGSMTGSSVRVGQDPVDGIFDNGNDRYYGGAESDIDSITILGTLSADSFFVAGAFPAKAFVNWRFIDTSSDPRFRLHELNRPPAALDQAVFGIEDTPLGGTLQAEDPDGDALTFSIVSAPTRGSLTLDASSGAFAYAPDEDANGLDSFTFQAFDGIEFSNIATVTLELAAVNDQPAAAADAYSTEEDVPLVVAAPGVLANDSDADGDALTAVLVEAPLAGHGTLELNADGWFTFTPEADFHGTATFRYAASDGAEQSAPVAVSITVNAVNDAPVAADDSYSVHAGQALTVDAPGLLANDFDVDGDTLALTRDAFNFPTNGTMAVAEDGSFTYTPNAGFAGVDTFSYRATDGTELSNLATVTISVLNEAPVAVDDSYSMVAGEVLTIDAPGFLVNDTDADGDVLFALRGDFPTNGTVHIASDGSFTYSPNEGFVGIDSFTYRAGDGVASSNFATVTIEVLNNAPVITSTAPVVATEGLPYVYRVLAADDDGDALSFELDLAPAGMAIDAAGAITWTPAEEQGPGVHDVVVRVSDGSESAVQAFAVTVAEVNLAPVLAPIGIHTVVEGGLLTFTASATDPDVPANTLSFSLEGAPAGASIDSTTGVFTWTAPETGRASLYSFAVHVTDNGVEPLEDSETISVVLYEEGDSVVFWNVDASGSWADAGSWSGGLVPTAADIVVVDRPNADVTVTVSGAAFSAQRLIATDDVTITGAGASLALGDGATAAADGAVAVLAAGRLALAPGSESSIEALSLSGTGSTLVNQGVLTLPSFDLTNVSGGTFHNAATGVLSVQSDSITVGNGVTLIEDGDLRGGMDADTIGSFTVNGGGTVTHSQGLESGLAFTVTGTLAVNGSINVSGRGYLGANNSSFPGLAGQTAPGLAGASGAAGSYGGLGGSMGGTPNATYGSTTAPTHLGSGGGRTSTGNFVNGGSGGGRVDITAGNVVITGTIAADGASGANAGAGSGGSIRLSLLPGGTVSGTGVIQANGGSSATASTGGGGGGRVAVLDFAGMSLSSNNVRAFPGDAASDGQAGTVYLESAAQADGQGDLIINAGNIAGARPVELDNAMAGFNSVLVRNGRVVVPLGADVAVPLILQAGGLVMNQGTLTLGEFSPANITAGSFHNTTTGILHVLSDQITIGGGVTLTEDGDLRGPAGTPDTLSAFTVNSGGVVTHSQGLAAGLSFAVTGTLTVNAGGVISVSGRGLLGAGQAGNISFTGQTIEGLAGSTGNAGGSHGGLGGAGSGGVPNATYGSEEDPVHLGSGGARTQIGAFVQAGNGGGRIDLSAGNFVVNGAILANGGNGFNSTGGSGGSIRLEVLPTGAGDVSGTGEIRANGGSEGGSGGGDAGGGGGRVAILEYNALTLPVSRITAAGGAGLFPGQAGTVYLRSADDAPVAADDTYAATEDTPLTIAAEFGVLGNDVDADGAVLSAVLVSAMPVTDGAVVLNADGSFTFAPALDFNGTTSFTYRASDGEFLSGLAAVTIEVAAMNDRPLAAADEYSIAQDSLLVGGTSLLKDIRAGTLSGSPSNLTNVGGVLFFSATDGVAGRELWKMDGSSSPFLVKDINPAGDAAPSNLTDVNGTLFFTASNGTNGQELWKSDGTAAGTTLVRDIVNGSGGSNPSQLTNVNGTLFFLADTPANGVELWKSDGTVAGTVLVKDIRPGSGDALFSTSKLTAVGETLFFNASDGVNGIELWKSDGTATGTVLVKDLAPGSGSTFSTEPSFAAMGELLFFSAGGDLWKSDGTDAGTVMVKEILTTGSASFGDPVAIDGTLFFTAVDDSGFELWKSDGTEAGTVRVKDIRSGFQGSNPDHLTDVSGTLFFSADDGFNGRELWKSDGTEAGTVLVKNIRAGSVGGLFPSSNLIDVGGTLFFNAADGIKGPELWKSDGTAAGTVLVKDIFPGNSGGDPIPGDFVDVAGTLFFSASDGVQGRELWRTDGTAAGTAPVEDVNVVGVSSNPGDLVEVNGTLLFTASDGSTGLELWRSDGTAAGTRIVRDIPAGSGSFSPFNLTNVGGTLFFSASDSASIELWKSDGTAAGTVRVKDIAPGSGASASSPANLTDVDGTLFFSADNGLANGRELWKSDGTDAGTVMVRDISVGGSDSNPAEITNVGGRAFFAANDGTGIKLWMSDGTADGTVMVLDATGATFATPSNLADVNGTLFFTASRAGIGVELWKSDGTAAGTMLVKDILAGLGGSDPTNLTNINGTLFFSARGIGTGLELWKSDGTEAGTVLVKNINSFSSSSNPSSLTNVDGTLFFAANDGTSGIELWKSDGTESGTVMVRDIAVGAAGSLPANLTNVNGSLLFTATDGTNGIELWRSDGTPEGTVLVRDIRAGSVGGSPAALTNVNGTLFFTADDETHGRELWVSGSAASVLANDADADSATLSAQLVSGPSNGTLSFHDDGTFTYRPNAGFVGVDTFDYQVSDDELTSNITTAAITVGAAMSVVSTIDADAQGATLSEAELNALVDAAIDVWAHVLGYDDPVIAGLDEVTVRSAGLSGAQLGYAQGNTIVVDNDAAGHGWFVDTTPFLNEEYELASGDVWKAFASSPAYQAIDLFTVVLHEVGHVLGFDHESGWTVMDDTLAPGKRYTIDWDADYASKSPFAVKRSLAADFSEFLKVV